MPRFVGSCMNGESTCAGLRKKTGSQRGLPSKGEPVSSKFVMFVVKGKGVQHRFTSLAQVRRDLQMSNAMRGS